MSAKKKVIFCTYSSIYSSKVLEQLIADDDIDLVAIINSTRVFSPKLSAIKGSLKQLKISGLRYSTYLFLISDFFKWMQPLLRIHKWPLRNVHSLADINNIPIIDTRDINSFEEVAFIKEHNPDILLCAHFNQLLKDSIFSIKQMQCINIHPSLLPAFKGVDPVFFAMKSGSKEIGVTLHKMDEQFDTGEILLQTAIKTDDSKSLLFNNCQLFDEGVKLALGWIKNDKPFNEIKLASVDSHVTTQDQNSYDSWPTSADVSSFKKSGYRLMRLSGLWKQQ